ncbi:MAG: aminotransferase class V-fold PLP-dependent enzyme [Kordiimonadaceae bacterium]|jgi:selenocysteine lyase/cysteine desulfurase|nr:aminotransferase class V-fold PLP-dependent enzyme [Kordiimonadaceae bacterium]MBT6032394.1 aminotransferase class V-fold PLP-dependent enzyme [Kordiimonadaceae bacterium]
MSTTSRFDPKSPLPHKQAFFPMVETYFNAGVQHPLSRGCLKAIEEYVAYKGFHTENNFDPIAMREKVKEQFAELINADAQEISFVGSTTAGENLIIQALQLINKGGRVVTDDLHYFGSYQIYGELEKRGVEVITIRHKDGIIDMADYEAAITDDTTLVAVSGVSTFNGFAHDLKRICEIAHRKKAYVYADMIHQIGAVPFDVKDTDVDFCSCGSFKWLMADQGIGFIYVKKNLLEQIERPWFGKRQVKNLTTHVFPGDEANSKIPYEYDLDETTDGYFSVWSEPRIVIAQLHYSLSYLLECGVERIMKYRQPMIDYLQTAIPKLGFKPLTSKESPAPILAFECDNAHKKLGPLFKEAKISASLYKGHFRVAISVYNDMEDVKYLIDTLKKL